MHRPDGFRPRFFGGGNSAPQSLHRAKSSKVGSDSVASSQWQGAPTANDGFHGLKQPHCVQPHPLGTSNGLGEAILLPILRWRPRLPCIKTAYHRSSAEKSAASGIGISRQRRSAGVIARHAAARFWQIIARCWHLPPVTSQELGVGYVAFAFRLQRNRCRWPVGLYLRSGCGRVGLCNAGPLRPAGLSKEQHDSADWCR